VDTRSGGLCPLELVLFEEYWGEHADPGVTPSAVVAFPHPASGGGLGLGFGGPAMAVMELGFEGRPERLRGGIVPAPVRPMERSTPNESPRV
jgi:hypothetical protein